MPNQSIATINSLSFLVSRKFQVSYADAIKNGPMWDKMLSSVDKTSDLSVDYPFIYPTVAVDQYEVGEQMGYNQLIGDSVKITAKKWGKNVFIRQTDFFNKQQHTLIMNEVQSLATNLAWVRHRQILNALRLGDTDAYYTVYDGQQLFSASHEVGYQKAAWGNLGTTALSGAALQAAINNFGVIPYAPADNTDMPYLPILGAKFYLIIPQALKDTASLILHNEYLYEANIMSSNVYSGKNLNVELLIDANLQDANDWMVAMELPGQAGGRPFVTLEQQVPGTRALIPLVKPTDENVIHADRFEWSAKSFEETFPTQFFLLYKSAVA